MLEINGSLSQPLCRWLNNRKGIWLGKKFPLQTSIKFWEQLGVTAEKWAD